jgi:hypothetical protein
MFDGRVHLLVVFKLGIVILVEVNKVGYPAHLYLQLEVAGKENNKTYSITWINKI